MKTIFLYGILLAGAAMAAFPLVWMLGTALKSVQEAASPEFNLIPNEVHWENIRETLNAAPFGRYFANTLFVSGTITIAVCFTSIPAGYAFARLRFRGAGVLFALMLATMMVPFEITLIPNFILIQRFGWYDTYQALIVPWCASAFSVFLMRQGFQGIPGDYFDAGRVDGCGHLRFLWWVGVPLVRPMLVTVSLFAFLGSYNALVWPLIVTGTDEMRLVQVGLTVFSGAEGVRYNLLMCAAAIVIAPTVLLYFAAQRYFMEGSLSAGIKG